MRARQIINMHKLVLFVCDKYQPIESIGKRVPQVSSLRVKLRFQDSRMDSVMPQITFQAIGYFLLEPFPFRICFLKRPPEMRYGMYLVDVVTQPFFKRL